MHQRITELEAAAHAAQQAASLKRISDMKIERVGLLSLEQRLKEVEQRQIATEKALSQASELKRKAESELDVERKKLSATETLLKQKSEDLEAQRAHLAAVTAQLADQRAEVARLEHEHAELVSRLHMREDTAAALISTVKIEAAETKEALEQTSQLKRKADEQRDEANKRARTAEDELEQKTEQLEHFNCVLCLDARANVVYLPCGHIACCEACDATYEGGPKKRAAAAGHRSCPKCRTDIKSASKAFVG